MSDNVQQRGGAPVGYLSDLNPVEAAAVLYLRMWSEGPESQAKMSRDIARILGSGAGKAALSAFDDLCSLCAHHGRRPLMRHSLKCGCIGADECCFANLVGAASDGDQEDAMLIATMIVRADMAPCLAGLAETFGLALKRMALMHTATAPQNSTHTTLH